MALKVRYKGPSGGSRLCWRLRAAFRGSVAAFGALRLHSARWSSGGVPSRGRSSGLAFVRVMIDLELVRT
jgi:hypothetical protein